LQKEIRCGIRCGMKDARVLGRVRRENELGELVGRFGMGAR